MAETPRESIKQWLLLAYLAFNIVLVLFIWADNLSDKQGNTGFIRSPQGTSAPANGAGLNATPGAASPADATKTRPHKGPDAEPETPMAPVAPSRTPVPNRDSGDLGMIRPLPGAAFSGS